MATRQAEVDIPTLVKIKAGALPRLGLYLRRHGLERVALCLSEGLPEELVEQAESALEGIGLVTRKVVTDAALETAQTLFAEMDPRGIDALVGLGGGKALDVAKYIAFLSRKPYVAVPTSLSNDGFCSPQSSLTIGGARRSLPAAMPFGVVVDTSVCLGAPRILWQSGVGDLVAKITAVRDWKLSMQATGETVNDLAALLSDATVYQFMAEPSHDAEGMRLLATALMLNGIAMAIAGSSRPASGSEHLISHALDEAAVRPRLHGLQVGVATYLVSCVQGERSERIAKLFDRTGFWEAIAGDPFSRAEWRAALERAPTIKRDFHTILTDPQAAATLRDLIDTDPRLGPCFTA